VLIFQSYFHVRLLENKKGGEAMTQEELLKQLQFCKARWNGWREDVFQEACLIALNRYEALKNVNQSLFGLLCREAARKLLRHKRFEVCFSELQDYQNLKGGEENEPDMMVTLTL